MILFFLILAIYSAIIIWFINGFLNQSEAKSSHQPFISIIVAAHNEEKHLGKCLNALIQQNYPKDNYEIIIVNDRSTDQTQSIIELWQNQFNFVKSIGVKNLPRDISPKKNALAHGIEVSKGDILCFTDADCVPSKNWVKSCSKSFSENVNMAVGLAPLIPEKSNKPPLWQQLLAYESWFLSFVSISAINKNFPLFCTGRNLSYRKSTFLKLSGFAQIKQSLSGDDDLLMHQFQKSEKGKIAAITNPDSIVMSQTPETLTQFWRQKTRHFSAGKYYPLDKKIFYFIWNLCNLVLTILPIIALITSLISLSTSLIILFSKLAVDFIFVWTGLSNYKKLKLLKYFLQFELLYPFYILIIGNIGLVKKPKW